MKIHNKRYVGVMLDADEVHAAAALTSASPSPGSGDGVSAGLCHVPAILSFFVR